MEINDDSPKRMDPLHQVEDTKSSQTPAPICGMKKHSAWRDDLPTDFYTIESGSGYSRAHESNTITCLAGGEEMLRVSPEGFWVRGQRVAQDDNEAQAVYNAFKSWMTWSTLNKDYK